MRLDIPIYLVLDNAGGHGTKTAVTNYTKALKQTYNIHCHHQVPNSPEKNLLDLGVWMTIQSDVERKHINKVYTKDALAESVIQAWENFNDFTKMQIIMQRWKKVLDLIIQDNGIGRSRSQELKTTHQSEGKSTGMKNTEERLRIIKQLYNQDISLTVSDLNDDGTGTKVEIEIPKKYDA